jgi:hypothetical protein
VAREEWPVVIHGHHPAYITWEAFLANEKQLAMNHTRSGARPAREGAALLQGMVACGCCGRAMSTIYSFGRPMYDCSHSRANHTKTPGCRAVVASLIDPAVAERLLAAVAPERIALALTAAEEATARRERSTRAVELQVERARYEAARAERAFHRCEPENRLVARSLEQRWEGKLVALREAEATLAAARAATAPLPARTDLEALASDLPRLWAAPTTSPKDRKRLVRALIADVTLRSEPGPRVRVGIRWRTGATEELVVFRSVSRQTPPAAIELVRRLADRSDKELVAELAGAGLCTGTGRPFTVAAVHWIRYAHRIPSPPPTSFLAPGELTVTQVAARLGVDEGVVYQWIGHGKLGARHGAGGRLCVPFSHEGEETCRQRVRRSTRIRPRSQKAAAECAV